MQVGIYLLSQRPQQNGLLPVEVLFGTSVCIVVLSLSAYSFIVMAMVIDKAVRTQHFSINYSAMLFSKFSYS